MVKNKIQSLRGSFRKELKKIQNSQKSGSGTEDIYKSQLWYFPLMTFLTDHEQPTESVDNLDSQVETRQENDDEDGTTSNNGIVNQETGENTTTVETNRYEPTKKKKKAEEDEKRKFLKACTEALGTNEDETENDAFGKFISKKLTKISNSEQRMYAEALLTKVVNYAILNKLNEFSDIIGNYSTSTLRDANTPMSNYSTSSAFAPHQPTGNAELSSGTVRLEIPVSPQHMDGDYEDVACYETIDTQGG